MSCGPASASSQTIGRHNGVGSGRIAQPRARATAVSLRRAAYAIRRRANQSRRSPVASQKPQHDGRSDVGGHHGEAVGTGQLRQQAAQSAGQLVGLTDRG